MQVINKKIIVIFICLSITCGLFKLFNKQEIKLDDVVLDIQKQNNSFAIYVEEGKNNYNEKEIFPEDGYVLNEEKSQCMSIDGNVIENILSYDYENNKVIVDTTESISCYLYFDEKENISKVCNKSNMQECVNSEDKMSQLKTIENLSNNIVGDMYRYQGTDNVANWLCFGTEENCSQSETSLDKYMYRIIGLTERGELKLIKETFVKEGDVATFQWNDKYLAIETECGLNGEKCTWPDSMIFKRLNGISKGSTKGTEGNSDIFIGNSYYEYLSNTSWLNKIEERLWKYGNTVQTSFDGDAYYELENVFTTDKTVLGTEPKAKIGLMYVHDYLYTYKTNDSDAGEPQNYTNASKAWIFFKKNSFNSASKASHEWLLSVYPLNYTGNGDYIPGLGITSKGNITGNNVINKYLGVRPVFYLTPAISLKPGTIGTKTNPYIINVS